MQKPIYNLTSSIYLPSSISLKALSVDARGVMTNLEPINHWMNRFFLFAILLDLQRYLANFYLISSD
jgi:hypothetical protein